MFLLHMLLIIAKAVEITVVAVIISVSIILAWDLSENIRIEQRKLRQLKRAERERIRRELVLSQRQARRDARSEEIRERAKEQLRAWKEAEANRRFFDDPGFEKFKTNFDPMGRLIHDDWLPPTEESKELLAEMRKLDDNITITTFEGAL